MSFDEYICQLPFTKTSPKKLTPLLLMFREIRMQNDDKYN